jgi:hypothetical protein
VPETSGDANAIVRRAFLRIEPGATLAAVDGLDLRAHAKVTAVVGVPLRQLQQRRDVAAFATSAPIAAVRGLLELMALAPLEHVVELLGEHADNPTFDELATAIDELLAGGASVDDAVSVLAFAVGESFPAAASCRRLLEERPAFLLPALPEAAVASVLPSPRVVSPEVREQRRARREEEKRRRRAAAPTRPPRAVKSKSSPSRPSSSGLMRPRPVAAVPEERRRILFTPLESVRFDAEHALVGSVVVVDVPFSAVDPAQPDVTSKERPALVVAASEEGLLIRPIYSSPSPTRSVFQPWRRIGLDHVCYVDDERVAVVRTPGGVPVSLGTLTTAEWNALL